MSFDISGKIVKIYTTQQISEKFRKREFVLELTEEINGNIRLKYAKFVLINNKVDIMDRFKTGDEVKVDFNLSGNK